MGLGTRGRAIAIGLGLATATAALVACSGAPAATPETGAPSFAAYVACLQRHGVNPPQNSAGPRRSPGASGRPSNRPSGAPSRSPGGFGGGGFGGGGFGGAFGTEAPAGVDQATWDAARQACAPLRPTSGPSARPDSATVAYRNCLSEHGVVLGRGQLNTADPTVTAALRACAPLRPTPTPAPAP